jgi:hypothetical protein
LNETEEEQFFCPIENSVSDGSPLAEAPQVDLSHGLERVVQFADSLEAKQQSFELVFPAEHPLDDVEALFKNFGLDKRLSASFGCFSSARILVNVGDHLTIENCFSIDAAIVSAIQSDDASSKINAHVFSNTRQFLQRRVDVGGAGGLFVDAAEGSHK